MVAQVSGQHDKAIVLHYCSLLTDKLGTTLDQTTRKIELRESLLEFFCQSAIECLEGAVLLDQLLCHAEFLISETQSVMRLGHSGIEGGGLFECVGSVSESTQAKAREAETVIGFGDVWIEFYRFLEGFDRFAIFLQFQKLAPLEKVSIRVIGVI